MTGIDESRNSYRVLVINPGSTSTKVAVFLGSKEIFRQSIQHPAGEAF
jgi:butyrate kinase